MLDRYLDPEQTTNRLIKEFKQYNTLFIAFDFDNTIFDYHRTGDSYPKMIKLLQELQAVGCTLILFTANEYEQLQTCLDYCTGLGITVSYVNENPLFNTRKPYYNILLDDRAGLDSSYLTCINLLQNIKETGNFPFYLANAFGE